MIQVQQVRQVRQVRHNATSLDSRYESMKSIARFIGLTILGILLTGGLLSSFNHHPTEAAFTAPPASRGVATAPNAPITSPPATAKSPGAITPTVQADILSQDTFRRADQLFWGTTSNGQRWGADATTRNVFSIAGKTGQVANGQGTFNATLGPIIADAEVACSGSMSQFNQSNIGAVLRWSDTNDWYKSYIDGKSLVVLKRVGGMATRLGAVPFTVRPDVLYTLRFRIKGTTLSAKVWQNGNTEPTNWMVTVTDNTFQNGYGGLRFLLENGAVATVTSFKEIVVTANS